MPNAQTSKNLKIAIIGAGPAGLSTAEFLKEKGYTNCVVFEKSWRVGGQSLSISCDPIALSRELNPQATPFQTSKLVYELGSVCPLSSHILLGLFKKYKLRLGKKNLGKRQRQKKLIPVIVYSTRTRETILDFSKHWLGVSIKHYPKLFHDIFKLVKITFRYKQLRDPGYTQISSLQQTELSVPFEQFIDAQNLKFLGEPLKILYGIMSTLGDRKKIKSFPTLQAIKFLHQNLRFPLRYINGFVQFAREGYQTLWKQVAKQHNVVLGAQIHQIIRSEEPGQPAVTLKFEEGEPQYFDKLIVTPCPTDMAKIMDWRDEERSIFEKVLSSQGWRIGFVGKGLPHSGIYVFLEGYTNSDYSPFLKGFNPEGQIDKDLWLYSAFLGDTPHLDEAHLQSVADFLHEQFGGTVVKWLESAYWPHYVPHFSCEDTQSGIYHRFEALQGKNHTFYVGELISGSTHATVVDYTQSKINEFFE